MKPQTYSSASNHIDGSAYTRTVPTLDILGGQAGRVKTAGCVTDATGCSEVVGAIGTDE